MACNKVMPTDVDPAGTCVCGDSYIEHYEAVRWEDSEGRRVARFVHKSDVAAVRAAIADALERAQPCCDDCCGPAHGYTVALLADLDGQTRLPWARVVRSDPRKVDPDDPIPDGSPGTGTEWVEPGSVPRKMRKGK